MVHDEELRKPVLWRDVTEADRGDCYARKIESLHRAIRCAEVLIPLPREQQIKNCEVGD